MHTLERSEELFPFRTRPVLATLVLFIALAVFHTWPLALGLSTLSRHDNSDAMLNEWILAWVAHQIVTDPVNLFDGNIFYPEPNTLAFSEHLLLQSLLGAPLRWAGVPTLAVHSLAVIGGFALTGWTMALVIRAWTGDWWAAVLAGMLLAFNAYTLTHLAHIQAVHVQFLPLAMLFLDRLLVRPRAVTAIWLAVAFVLQSLASNYVMVFLTFGLIGAALSRPREWLTAARLKTLGLLCLAAATAILLLTPFLLPYLYAQRHQGLTRNLAEVANYAASWRDYLATGGRLHYEWWSARFSQSGMYLFPGFTAIALSGAAAATGVLWRPRSRMWLVLGIVGFVLSFGASLPGYDFLYRAMPLLQGIRVSRRFGSLLLAAVAAVAAFGLAAVRQRVADRPRLRTALSLAAIILVTLEAARVPMGYTPAYKSPAVYDFLSDEQDAVVVEFPFYSPRQVFQNGRYLLHATRHWRPMLNGYSGFMPASYATHWQALDAFPDSSALDYLRRLRVTHVAIHTDEFSDPAGQDRLRRVAATPDLTRLVHGKDLAIYRLERGER